MIPYAGYDPDEPALCHQERRVVQRPVIPRRNLSLRRWPRYAKIQAARRNLHTIRSMQPCS